VSHRNSIAISLGVALASLALFACGGGHRDPAPGAPGAGGSGSTQARGGTLTVKGSDTMVILGQRWAERYMQLHPGTTVQVSGGGSGTGIAALLNGTTDVANASRPLKASERTQLAARGHGAAVETRVALDALAVYVHESNTLARIDLEQLRRVFKGEVTNWSQLGGPDRPIILYSRENNSGTYAYFKEHVLDNADFATNAQTLPGTAAVINAVSHDPNGIGYGGIAYGSGVKHLRLGASGADAIEPTMENAVSGRYPLARFLFMVTAGPPAGLAHDYIEWIRSPAGQELVESVGYYPLPHEGARAQR